MRVPSDGQPKFVMVGVDRPGGGVRLYASRDIPPGRLNWGQRDTDSYAVAWHVEADMVSVLIIDKPTWGEAFARVFEIWENHDREQQRGAEVQQAAEAERIAKSWRGELTPLRLPPVSYLGRRPLPLQLGCP